MDIKDQVVSLNLAKRLKELNIMQESLFYWAYNTIISSCPFEFFIPNGNIMTLDGIWKEQACTERYSAFSVAELGEMLINVMRTPEMFLDTIGENEADVRATILICAIENNLVNEEWKKQWLEE